jgi:hypothetical protein
MNSENRLADERKLLEALLSASFHYVDRNLASYRTEFENKGKVVDIMRTAASKLPKSYDAMKFVEMLTVGETMPPIEAEKLLKEYFNDSWKMFLGRKHSIETKL